MIRLLTAGRGRDAWAGRWYQRPMRAHKARHGAVPGAPAGPGISLSRESGEGRTMSVEEAMMSRTAHALWTVAGVLAALGWAALFVEAPRVALEMLVLL